MAKRKENNFKIRTDRRRISGYQYVLHKILEMIIMYLNFPNDFFKYLTEWEESVKGRKGYDDNQKKRMLLSDQTLLRLRMTGKLTNTNHV